MDAKIRKHIAQDQSTFTKSFAPNPVEEREQKKKPTRIGR